MGFSDIGPGDAPSWISDELLIFCPIRKGGLVCNDFFVRPPSVQLIFLSGKVHEEVDRPETHVWVAEIREFGIVGDEPSVEFGLMGRERFEGGSSVFTRESSSGTARFKYAGAGVGSWQYSRSVPPAGHDPNTVV